VGVSRSLESSSLTAVLGHIERQVSRRLDETLAREKLTVDQWRVLDLLAGGHGHPMSVIGAYIAVPGATLTKLADRLVDAALVYRVVDESDRRRVLVHLSALGREAHERLRPQVDRIEADILAPLGEHSTTLVTLLNSLAAPTLPEPVSTAR
jgi:DNA-binding MarR family transcriptional regulator